MIFISSIITFVNNILHSITLLFLFAAIVLALTERIGLLRQFVHRLTEKELSKEMNGARVTVGSIDIDFWTGVVLVRDAIIHTPQRNEWGWDSPLIARIGYCEVKVSFFSCHSWLSPKLNYPCKEVYYLTVEDVQVFVEKRSYVFNFHLLDRTLDLPDPATLNSSEYLFSSDYSLQGTGVGSQSSPTPSASGSMDLDESKAGDVSLAESNMSDDTDLTNKARAEKRANEILNSVLGAVSTLGKAANEGGKEGLDRAFKNQKKGFVSQLKKLKENMDNSTVVSTNGTTSSDQNKDRMRAVAVESMNVIKEIGKSIDKNVKKEMGTFKKKIPKKQGLKKKKEIPVRIGRALLRDCRIFTKDMLIANTSKAKNDQQKQQIEGWSKPILLKEVAFSSADLSPSASERSPETGLPIIGLTPDKLVDAVMRRILPEMAKTNGGRLLQNVMGEVFAWMEVKGSKNRQTTAKTIKAA